jgi:hypothetical protein
VVNIKREDVDPSPLKLRRHQTTTRPNLKNRSPLQFQHLVDLVPITAESLLRVIRALFVPIGRDLHGVSTCIPAHGHSELPRSLTLQACSTSTAGWLSRLD